MSVIKWTMESVIAAVAVVATTVGGVLNTSYQYGQVTDKVATLQAANAATDAHVSKHDDQLANIQQQNAAMKQSVDDIKDTVHDIQTQVRKPHGNHE